MAIVDLVDRRRTRRFRNLAAARHIGHAPRDYRPIPIRSKTRPTSILPALLPRPHLPSNRFAGLVGTHHPRISDRINARRRKFGGHHAALFTSDIPVGRVIVVHAALPDTGANCRIHRCTLAFG